MRKLLVCLPAKLAKGCCEIDLIGGISLSDDDVSPQLGYACLEGLSQLSSWRVIGIKDSKASQPEIAHRILGQMAGLKAIGQGRAEQIGIVGGDLEGGGSRGDQR